MLLKVFKVRLRPLKTPQIIEVIWKSPPRSWIKVNYDSASLNSPGHFACGGIVGDHGVVFLMLSLIANPFIVELSGAMSAI